MANCSTETEGIEEVSITFKERDSVFWEDEEDGEDIFLEKFQNTGNSSLWVFMSDLEIGMIEWGRILKEKMNGI